MNIGMVLLKPSRSRFPPDIRVEKEIDALSKSGMRVSILCPRYTDDQPAKEELVPGATIYRRQVEPPWRIRRLWENWTLIRSRWKPVIEEFLRATRSDVLHVHDLNMVPTTLSVARAYGVPVVADLHENMPAAIRASRADHPWWSRVRQSVRTNGVLFRWHELRCARECEKIIVVVPEAAERFLKAGISEDKLVIVSNTEDETTMPLPLPDVDEAIAARYANRWVASYIGGIGPHRGIDTAVRGVPAIAKEVPNFLLLVVGASDDDRHKIEALASDCGVRQFVSVLGWEPFDKCVQYDLISKACLVPHNDFEHTQTTVPHKLFQYMICQRPVVVSDCRPLKRIVEAAAAGVIFRANDPNDFADAVIRLAKDDALCDRYGASGKRAALGEFAWKHDGARLVAMYKAIARKHGWAQTNGPDKPGSGASGPTHGG